MPREIGDLLQQRRYDEALERLFDLYEKKVFGMALAMLRDAGRAEEFLKIWRAFPSYDGRAAVSTWLYAIARNACLSAIRMESYRKMASLDDAPEPFTHQKLTDVSWDRYLARLPELQRQVITLFYFEDRSIRDVALMLDLAEGTVKSLLHRARRALSEMME